MNQNCKLIEAIPTCIVFYVTPDKGFLCILYFTFRGKEYSKTIGKEAFSAYRNKYNYSYSNSNGFETFFIIDKK